MAQTVMVLHDILTRYDLPEQLISDNSPRFVVSFDFTKFCNSHAIKHVWATPYYPASNGLARRIDQTFKQAIKRTMSDGLQLQHHIADFCNI